MKATVRLKGSCHCQAVQFSLRSAQVFPYQRCYCSICRKTQGGGGFSINLGGDFRTLKIKGKRYIRVYHARMKNRGDRKAHRSNGERHFCSLCGSALWVYDPDYPDLVHPFASAIDSRLAKTPSTTHLLLNSKASWVEPHIRRGDKAFQSFPDETIAQWHARHHKLNKSR